MTPMGKIQPGHVHAVFYHCFDHVRRTAGGTYGADYFCFPHGINPLNIAASFCFNSKGIDIIGKSKVLWVAWEGETAAGTREVPAADMYWLPSADSNHGHGG
jgi:hypothetical protein